ncbi:MAG: SDR family oxidoreductase [Pseudomonadota bacterium]
MSGRLNGKTALVTAAGQGIGRAIAQMYANEGAKVIATDLNADLLSGFEGDVTTQTLDVRDSAAVNAAAGEIGAVQILANVAGFVHHGSVLECDEDAWDFSFDLNVKSMHRMIAAFLPAMLESAESGNLGSIINMASGASSLKGAPNRYVYGATKAAVIGLTKSVAVDFIRKGVRCNAICPGTVRSPSWEERVAELGKEVGSAEKAMEMFVSRQPMGRVGEADEIAALATYLAGDESAFTTGVAIPIDGGWTL